MKPVQWIICSVLAIILLGVLSAIPITDAVTIVSIKEEKMLAYFPVETEGSRFDIVYTHSIHLTEVRDSYVILNDGTIRQTGLEFEDTGVGMPANAEEGETFKLKDGKYYIDNMKRDFSWIDLSTGQVRANHRLVVRGKVIPFSTFAEPGSLVRIKKEKISLWRQWEGVKIVGR
ncbi:DUF1850 domain-containing protein [Siminovitchia sediminis]|uniref:DUF1850 domain-containing protein n=1 Tax=Siminovitchia sediminis TaxID=1274353 RepID=A0ABW4KER5_9BACI